MAPLGPISSPPSPAHHTGDDVAHLLRHVDPTVRVIGARLAGRLDLAFLRPALQTMSADTDPAVREAAAAALASLAPNGGRGSEAILRHGGFATLKAHQAAEISYDATVVFCDRFIDKRSRTHDQMVQAARSGKQNIVEGSAAAGTSCTTELRLVGVARASFEELIADYQDFLRQRGLPLWAKDNPKAAEVRKLAYVENRSYSTYRSYFQEAPPEVAANTALCLVHQACYLLDRLLKQLEGTFLEHGGITERLHSARLRHRELQFRERRE